MKPVPRAPIQAKMSVGLIPERQMCIMDHCKFLPNLANDSLMMFWKCHGALEEWEN